MRHLLYFSFIMLIAFSYACSKPPQPVHDESVALTEAEKREQLLAQDWAQLKRFAGKNDTLLATKTEVEAVFMGNSITEGWDYHLPAFFKEHPSWINRGISGQTTPQMLVRFRQDVIELQPRVVVILAGINDIAANTGAMTLEQILGNIESMAQLAKANNIKVVLSSVLPAYDFPWRTGMEPAPKVVKLNAMLQALETREGYVYLDYFTPMADDRPGLKAGLHEDEVHPLKAGYEIMRPLAEAAVARALAQ